MTADAGLVGAVKIDLRRLHESWMELLFPRQLDAEDSVLGKWTPSTTAGWVKYRFWAAVGVLAVALLYPLLVVGMGVRFHARRLDSTGARLGVIGTVLLAAVVWGLLAVVARYRFSPGGFVAVVAAAVVAAIAAGLAVLFTGVGGRGTTVLLAYPAAMTAIFLPPVVAALYSPTVADAILPRSESLAIWLLDNVLTVGNLNEYLRSQYDLRGIAYVGMWLGISVPVGWLLGGAVTLADFVRPE